MEKLDVRHGLLQAVRGVSLEVSEGETLALVGANGAGKTTLLRTLAGAHAPSAGRVVLDGADVTRLPAHERVRRGLVLVPEGRHLFPDLTVEEDLLVARAARRSGPWSIETVCDAFPILGPLLRRRASALSGGEQHATAIGRALMTNPRVLLLDEISLGLAPAAVEGLYRSLGVLLEGGATIVLVEQDLSRALSVATRIACLLEGRVVLEAAPGEISREDVVSAYFGLRR
jgi:branched-chain amino acid transport system ATP-binding protein